MNYALKGHAMKRGTLMFLKRLFVTALGALGLGALLASGTASAQQLPAPKVLGSVANCQGTARTAQGSPGRNQNRSPLDIILTGGDATDPATTPIARNSADADITADQETQLLTRLTIDMTAAPCDANPVAGGYQRAIDLYEAYMTAKGALPREDDDPDEESNLERAARLARMDKDAFGGDVYNKVYDLLMKEKTVEDAIDDYNALVGTDGRLAALQTAYEAISIAITTDAAGETLDDDGLERLYGEDEIRGYQAIASGEFNPAGVLQLEDTASTSVTTIGGIVTELQTREATLTTASNFLKAARDAGNLDTRTLEEAERRARVARDHVKDELDRLTAIVRAQNRAYADGSEITIGTGVDEVVLARNHRQVLSGFGQIGTQVDMAQKAVVDAVKALDTANKGARDALGNAKAYLNQLVTLREFDQAKAQAAHDEVTNPAPALVSDLTDAKKATMAAKDLRTTYQDLTGDSEDPTPANELVDALLKPQNLANGNANPEDDDGLAVVQAVTKTYDATQANEDRLDALLTTADDGTETGRVKALEDKVTMLEGGDTGGGLEELRTDLDALTAMDDPETMDVDETGAVTKNANDITALDGRVAENESDIGQIQTDLYGTTSGQHGDLVACDGTGLLNVATCADARSRHNEADIEDVNDKLMQKKEYIDNLAAEIGVDPVTGEGTGDDGMSRIDMNEAAIAAEEKARMEADTALGGRIDAEAMARADADMALGMRIDGEAMARADGDVMLATAIEEAVAAGAAADMALGGRITSNANDIAANMNAIGQNRSAISDNRNMIGELSDDLDVVRAGVAASMALAGMPAINGRGIAIGVGSYDGESAFAVGFQIQGEQASFKVGVTSSGGETGASAGVGFNF